MIIARIYNGLIRKRRDAISFLILFFFFITFVASRTINYLNTAEIIPDSLMINRNLRGVHVHHLAFGIIILTIAGYLALFFHGQTARHRIAVLYGIGLGLAYDEFGMWLMLKDAYWVRQSYDAIALISVLLINVVYFGALWQKIILKILSIIFRILHLRYAKSHSLLTLRKSK